MEPKAKTTRPNSKMNFIVAAFNAGTKSIEALALKLKEAEETGVVTGLKKTDPEHVAKKDLAYYKKVVNWYINQAKHKQLIDAPFSARQKARAELIAAKKAGEANAAPTAPVEAAPAQTDAPAADESLIPTI